MRIVPLFRSVTGLNNVVDPARLNYSPRTGVSELSECKNIIIDPSGRPSLQPGYTMLTPGSYSSMCPEDCGGYTLALKSGNTLVSLDPDGNETTVRSNMSNARIDYQIASDGEKDFIYYLNGSERGKVYERTHYVWEKATYSGPDTLDTFDDPPNGHLLTLYNGRMYIAENNILWASVQHDFGKYLKRKTFIPFAGEILFLDHLDDGILISDTKATYYLLGDDVLQTDHSASFRLNKIYNYPLLKQRTIKIDAEQVDIEAQGDVILAWSDHALCAFSAGGNRENLTKGKLKRRTDSSADTWLPDSNTAASIVINNEHLITTFG